MTLRPSVGLTLGINCTENHQMSSLECTSWIEAAPEPQKKQLADLRRIILALGDGIVEEFKWSRPCYSNESGAFCYLHSTKNHATLGFDRGASLLDPSLLLDGTGKNMRHVKLKPGSDANSPEILALIRQAAGR